MKRNISIACLNMSDYFYKDCSEHLSGYDFCMNDDMYSSIKSWDANLFIDLRMAYEAILKATRTFSARADLFEIIQHYLKLSTSGTA